MVLVLLHQRSQTVDGVEAEAARRAAVFAGRDLRIGRARHFLPFAVGLLDFQTRDGGLQIQPHDGGVKAARLHQARIATHHLPAMGQRPGA